MDIGDIIRKLRKERGLTQKQLAGMTGLAEITIRQYEAKKFVPKQAQFKKLCEALQVDENSMIFANSIDFSKHIGNDEAEKWGNETLDFFASWLLANDVFFERHKTAGKDGYLFHIDDASYFITKNQKQALSKSSIELVKNFIKVLSTL